MFSVTFWLRLSRLSGDRRNPEDLGDMAEGKSKEMAKTNYGQARISLLTIAPH